MGWKQEKYFPINIAPAFLERCIFGYNELDLVQDFLLTLSATDKSVLQDASKEFFSADEDELMEVFSNLNCKSVPTSRNLERLISEIAHREIVQKSSFIIECWGPILENLIHRNQFQNLKLQPSPTQETC